MSPLSDKPHYLLHPIRLARRAIGGSRDRRAQQPERITVSLPWGADLDLSPRDVIGFSIATGDGIFDPCVTEAVHRLVDPGDLVVDVGANIGYVSSLAAVRAGAAGRVVAYEPHPQVFEFLAGNAARWSRADVAPVEPRQAALSDHTGEAELDAGPGFEEHMGLSTLAERAPEVAGERLAVKVERLDDALGGESIGLLKVDVEGHELEVLAGAGEMLRDGRVRDVIFEDHHVYPDACTELLEGAGYTLISLDNGLFGLKLRPPTDRGRLSEWPGPSYLATRDPERARARLEPRGWQVRGIGPTPGGAPWRRGRNA